jgi:hypothetical protein
MYPTEEICDNVSDLSVTVAGCYEDPTVADALAEMYRNEEAVSEAEVEQMHRAMLEAAEADGIEHGPFFHDLTPAKHAELIAMFPFARGWTPVIGYDANAATPFTSELRRGTPNGPDIVRLANYSTAENALRAAVTFAINMVLVDMGHGDEQARETIRSMIAYAKR